jgi:urease subunit alpha
MAAFYGGLGAAPARLSHIFVAQACLDDPAAKAALPTGRNYTGIQNSRGLSSEDMRFNTRTPSVEVSQSPEPVRVDGVPVGLHRATTLPLTRTHHLA